MSLAHTRPGRVLSADCRLVGTPREGRIRASPSFVDIDGKNFDLGDGLFASLMATSMKSRKSDG